VESGFLFDPVELGGIELPFEFFYDGFIQGASYDGNIYGVPVVIAGICQYYNKKYEPMLKDLFSASGFWDYMERLARVSEEVKTIGFESMIANAESLFALSMLASFDGVPSYDNMKNFESAEFSKFIRRFERYFTDERIFLRGVDFHTADALMQFLEGKTPILMGNASWMAQIVEKSPFEAGIMPQFIEKSGVRQIASNINSISAWTPYPEECFEILKYLSGYEAQKILAENGRPVANLKANKHLKFKRFDDKALEKVMRSWEDGRVLSSGDPGIDEYIKTVINPEISKWQKRELSSYEFVVVLKRKTNFFYRSKSLKSKILTLECEV
jgi:maltose-binding protein MalE